MKKKSVRPATLRAKYLPRKDEYIILVNGKENSRCKEMDSFRAFERGWRAQEQILFALNRRYNAGEINDDQYREINHQQTMEMIKRCSTI